MAGITMILYLVIAVSIDPFSTEAWSSSLRFQFFHRIGDYWNIWLLTYKKIIACFNCLKRPDWNFAFGLLCFYMLRRNELDRETKITTMVRTLNTAFHTKRRSASVRLHMDCDNVDHLARTAFSWTRDMESVQWTPYLRASALNYQLLSSSKWPHGRWHRW